MNFLYFMFFGLPSTLDVPIIGGSVTFLVFLFLTGRLVYLLRKRQARLDKLDELDGQLEKLIAKLPENTKD